MRLGISGVLVSGLIGVAGSAQAEAPRVMTDISPVHGLVAMVMEGVGKPEVLLGAGQSPHGASLKISQARALQEAQLIVSVSHVLTPWLEQSLDALGDGARHIELMDVAGTQLFEIREGHSHDDHEEHDDHEGHDDHDDHDDHEDHADHDDHEGREDHADHDDHEGHDDHDDHEDHKGHDDHAEHAAGAIDPHGWLNPVNASLWLAEIGAALSEIDPENAAVYQENVREGREIIAALDAELEAVFHPLEDVPFMVLHDGYRYLEERYELRFEGSVLDGAGGSRGPASLEALAERLEHEGVACIMTEPQLNDAFLNRLAEGADLTIGVIDPLGADIATGPGHYPALMQSIARGFAECLSPSR